MSHGRRTHRGLGFSRAKRRRTDSWPGCGSCPWTRGLRGGERSSCITGSYAGDVAVVLGLGGGGLDPTRFDMAFLLRGTLFERFFVVVLVKTDIFNLTENQVIHHLVVFHRILLVLSFPLGETVLAHFVVAIGALQTQSQVFRLKLRETSVIGDVVWDIRKLCSFR